MQKGSFDAEKKTVQLQSSLVGNASKVSDQTWSSQRGVILSIHNGSFRDNVHYITLSQTNA
jgi:hypothetical protein